MRRFWLSVILTVSIACAVANVWLRREDSPRPLDDARPAVVLANEYVGSDACLRCHADQHATWSASYHRTMTQTATPANIQVPLDKTVVELRGATYEFSVQGEEIHVEMPDFAAPASPERIRRRLTLVTGSHHMHIFWFETGESRRVAMLPIVYRLDEQRWIPRRSAFLDSNRDINIENGRWNVMCSRCHSTNPRPHCDQQTEACETEVAEFGISCEACHGPGQGHVLARSGTQAADSVPDRIVNPERLPSRTASEVCAQCHSYYVLSDESYDNQWLRTGFNYRPGESLEESSIRRVVTCCGESDDPVVNTVLERFPGHEEHVFWSDGMVRVSGRDYQGLIESPCYQRGELSCLSCHTMHAKGHDSGQLAGWASDQLKPGMQANAACLQCHAEIGDNLSAHTHHAIDSSGSNCMNCHMPHTTYGLLKAIRSHEISSPSVETFLNTERPLACNLCHLDRTLAWSADHLADWYGHPVPALPDRMQTTSASVLQLLTGDAGARALVAWSFGWRPAQEVSGTDWMPPFLLTVMNDPYDAVRQIATGSLRSLPDYQDYVFEFTAPESDRQARLDSSLADWLSTAPEIRQPNVLFDSRGRLDMNALKSLLAIRNNHSMYLSE